MICESCSIAKTLLDNDIWLHMGSGTLTTVEYQSIDLNNFSINGLKEITNVFNPVGTDIGNGRKPVNCIWFSNGRWSFDPYNSFTCNDHDIISGNFLAIKNPKNILHVETFKEFTDFHKKYGNMIIDRKSMLRNHTLNTRNTFCGDNFDYLVILNRISNRYNIDYKKVIEIFDSCIDTDTTNIQKMIQMFSDTFGIDQESFETAQFTLETCAVAKQSEMIKDIPDTFVLDQHTLNWQSVKNAGYYGVAFHFKDLYNAFGVNMNNWHDGFDVESLVVWDLRAFDNKVIPICV